MKKYFCFLVAVILSLNSYAQKHELKVMYSPWSLMMVDKPSSLEEGLKSKFMGAFMADYNRYINSWLKVGANFTVDYKKTYGTLHGYVGGMWPNLDVHSISYEYANRETWLAFGPQIGVDYLRKPNFRLGSLLGLSAVYNTSRLSFDWINEKEADLDFFFHAELLNFSWGKTNGLTGQIGFGHKGVVSVGYFVRW